MTNYYKMSTSVKMRLRNQRYCRSYAVHPRALTAAASPGGSGERRAANGPVGPPALAPCPGPAHAAEVWVRPVSSAPEEPCALVSGSPRPLPQTHLLTSFPTPGTPKHRPWVHLQLIFLQTLPDIKQ